MKHRRRGKAYIFNHECFDPSLGLSRRFGSSTDVSNLQIALYGLGFQVFGFNDLGVCDVRKIIQERNFGLHFLVLHSLLLLFIFFLNILFVSCKRRSQWVWLRHGRCTVTRRERLDLHKRLVLSLGRVMVSLYLWQMPIFGRKAQTVFHSGNNCHCNNIY